MQRRHHHSFEEVVEARDDGLKFGDSLFDGGKAIAVKMAQELGTGEIGHIAGASGGAGIFEGAVFVPAEAEDHHAVSRIGKHRIRPSGTGRRFGRPRASHR